MRLQRQREIYQKYSIIKYFEKFSGDFIDRVTPVPIPNTEVKPVGADDTASFRCGKVGRRRIYNLSKKPVQTRAGFLLFGFKNLDNKPERSYNQNWFKFNEFRQIL